MEAGRIGEFANDWDGYAGVIPKTSATIAEMLDYYGYATAAVGKWHNTPIDTLGSGPHDCFPTGHRFDHFYDFTAGKTSQCEPVLWDNTTLSGVVAELIDFRDSQRESGGLRACHDEARTCPLPYDELEIR